MASRTSTHEQPHIPKWLVEQMAAQGRTPVVDRSGEVTGFRSKHGAPLSAHDTLHGLGIGGNDPAASTIGTTQHNAAWNQWFHRESPAASKQPSAFASDPNDDSGMPALNPHLDPVGASIVSNSNWLRSNGITAPVSPAPLPPSANMMQFPSPLADPARLKSAFVSSAGVNAGYADAVSAYNKRLYAPADTQQSTFVPQPAATNWNRTGWNGPAQPVTTGNYTTPYGSASVNFGIPAPPAPADNSRWGWNTAA